MKFALVGNQNSGKTTLFNQLTGSNQKVGNFPGVTVDAKEGTIKDRKGITVTDLPGIYSLRPYTEEEIVTRDYILNEKPDGIIDIVDATNIERNLYLTTQLMTLDVPLIVALNMMDEIRVNNGSIDIQKMSEMLGVPVIPISASKNEGVDELINVVIKTAQDHLLPKVTDICEQGSPVHRCIHSTIHLIEDHAERLGVSSRFSAMNIIISGSDFEKRLGLDQNEEELFAHSIKEMEDSCGLDRDAAIAEMTYDFIGKVVDASVTKPSGESKSRRRSEAIDKFLTNKYAAIPIFIFIMLLIFILTFQFFGKWLGDLILLGMSSLGKLINTGLTNYGTNPALVDFIDRGIFQGLGSVLSLLPYVVIMFLFLSLLEDSGYMARVAFIMDKPLRKIGLSGRSFVPIILGFGCSVPAIMATRTMASERDRKLTIALIPFISCSAKAVVYYEVVNCGIFSFSEQLLIIVGLYLLGIVLGIVTVLVGSHTIIKGKPVPFMMELPDYRLPSMKSVFLLMWEKAKDFLKRAFTVIFLATLIVWWLESFNTRLIFITDGVIDQTSMLTHIGNFFAPLFYPLGIKDGRVVSALIAGFTAKEAVVSTINMLAGSGGFITLLVSKKAFLSFLTFILIYTPCVAAMGTMKKELNSLWKTIGVILYQCLLAWVIAALVYLI